jgi:hypothetical protein
MRISNNSACYPVLSVRSIVVRIDENTFCHYDFGRKGVETVSSISSRQIGCPIEYIKRI